MGSERVSFLTQLFGHMEKQYEIYERAFDCVEVNNEELPQIPTELLKVIKGKLGDEMSDWVKKEIPALDNQKVVDLVKTQDGIKAVKMLLFRME